MGNLLSKFGADSTISFYNTYRNVTKKRKFWFIFCHFSFFAKANFVSGAIKTKETVNFEHSKTCPRPLLSFMTKRKTPH